MRHSACFAALLAGAASLLLAGCGAPPEPAARPAPTGTPPASQGSLGPPPIPAPGGPGTAGPGLGDGIAVSCAGDPDQAELIDLLRAEGLLAAGTEPQVVNGPLCAGDWQYLVLTVPDLDPLQVVTRREAGTLQLVTAGTDVCTVEVRVTAPAGIRDAAACPA